jgi:hypothetical protein
MGGDMDSIIANDNVNPGACTAYAIARDLNKDCPRPE